MKKHKDAAKRLGEFIGYKKSGFSRVLPKSVKMKRRPDHYSIPYRGYLTEGVSHGSYEDYIPEFYRKS